MVKGVGKVGDKMLKFKMVESEDGKLVYRYFPEGKEDYGVISYDEKTDTTTIETLAKEDEFRWYALKMLSRIRKMKEKGTFDTEGMIAWY